MWIGKEVGEVREEEYYIVQKSTILSTGIKCFTGREIYDEFKMEKNDVSMCG